MAVLVLRRFIAAKALSKLGGKCDPLGLAPFEHSFECFVTPWQPGYVICLRVDGHKVWIAIKASKEVLLSKVNAYLNMSAGFLSGSNSVHPHSFPSISCHRFNYCEGLYNGSFRIRNMQVYLDFLWVYYYNI